MTPIARFQALQAELNPIQDKLPHDNKWFEVGSDGKLFLCKRHYWSRRENFSGRFFEEIWNCFCRIHQCIRSLFCNPYPILEKKIHELTGKINEYLTVEDDPKRRSEFLDQYSPAVTLLFEAASKLEKINRLKAPAIDSKTPIRQWMLADIPKDWYDAIKTEVFFSAKNENPKYPVRFALNTEEWEKSDQKPLSAKAKAIQKRFAKRFGEDWTIGAQFEHKGQKVLDLYKEFKIVIKPDGTMTYEQLDTLNIHPNHMTVYIENLSQFNLSLDFKGFTNEANTRALNAREYASSAGSNISIFFPTTIPANEQTPAALSRSFAEQTKAQDKTAFSSDMPPKADGVLHRLEFNVKGIQEKQVRGGCRSGQYAAILSKDGKLDVDIKAHRVFEPFIPVATLKKDQALKVTYTSADSTEALVLSGAENGPALSLFNNSKNRLNIDISVKPIANEDGSLAQPFGISNMILPSLMTTVWTKSLSHHHSLTYAQREAFKKLAEAEFAVTLRELATE